MKFGRGMISMWAMHYIRLYNLKVGFSKEIRAIEEISKKNKKNLKFFLDMPIQSIVRYNKQQRKGKEMINDLTSCKECHGGECICQPSEFTDHMICEQDDCGCTFSVYTSILSTGHVRRFIDGFGKFNKEFDGTCPACGSPRVFVDHAREEE